MKMKKKSKRERTSLQEKVDERETKMKHFVIT